MKRIFLLCLAVSTATAQNDSAAWFHPLHVGNEWIYRTSASQTSFPNPPITTIGIIHRTVERDTVIDNAVWSIVRNKNVKTGASAAVRERYDTLTSRFFSDDEIIDSVLCIQSGILFGSWKTVHNVYADTLLSKPTISRHLKWLLTGLSREWVFSYGLGMTREDKADGDILGGSGSRSEIAYARINGMEFGTKNILMADSLSQYHPLQTGNRWIYKTTSYNPPSEPAISYVSREVTGDTIIGTTLYKRMTEKNSAGVITGKSAERFDDITGNYIVHNISGPTIEDSAAANVVNSHFGVYDMRKLVALYTDSLFGIMRLHREIRMANHIAEHETGWIYAQGIGLVKNYIKELDPSPNGVKDEELVYAKINGVEFGTEPLSVENGHPFLPAEVFLSQNFPNPFNPVTTIAYSLPERHVVVLRVFDMLGRNAATLVNEPQTAGLHSVQFDGSALASGLYFYQLQAGNFIATKKMLLLK